MTNQEKVQILKVRLHKLQSKEKNIESPGVVNKIKRQIKALEKE